MLMGHNHQSEKSGSELMKTNKLHCFKHYVITNEGDQRDNTVLIADKVLDIHNGTV